METMTESKTCQACKQQFVIEPADFDFYKKISVPPPTWCPTCRYQRRMSWRNTWHLFKKKDAKTQQEIFSIFPEESPVKIYERNFWNSDAWDPMDYGREYDWSIPFLEQFKKLLYEVPLPAHSVINLSNCEYCTNANELKNCYFVRASTYSEDSLYLIWDHGSKRCLDSHMTNRCELGYGNVNTARSYKTFFSADCEDCQSVILSKDCIGCSDCFGCIGLRNKSHYIFNEPYSKEEYAKKIKSLDIGSAQVLAELTSRAYTHWKKYPHKFMHGRQNTAVSGDYIYESKNATQCFRIRGAEDSKFCQNLLEGPSKDCYDYSNWGQGAELIYECLVGGVNIYNIRCSWQAYSEDKNLEYSVFCHNSSDLFGCVALRNKQYCIFNKQYTKEEFIVLRSKIIEQMNKIPYVDAAGKEYRYGEFFPPEMSPFPYTATEAFEFFPISQGEAVKKSFVWYEPKRSKYEVTLKNADIPDRIKNVKDDILSAVIECAHKGECREECTSAFRVVGEELKFLRQFNIALPRLCQNCRHYGRTALRNPSQFFHRRCECPGTAGTIKEYTNTSSHFHSNNSCPNEFETAYAPDRPEIVYCEQCYNAEVA